MSTQMTNMNYYGGGISPYSQIPGLNPMFPLNYLGLSGMAFPGMGMSQGTDTASVFNSFSGMTNMYGNYGCGNNMDAACDPMMQLFMQIFMKIIPLLKNKLFGNDNDNDKKSIEESDEFKLGEKVAETLTEDDPEKLDKFLKGDNVLKFNSRAELIKTLDGLTGNKDEVIKKDEIAAFESYVKAHGIDKIIVEGKEYNVVSEGTSGNDFLISTEVGADVDGKNGNDFILAANAEEVHGGRGHDRIIAATCKKVKGSKGNDHIYAYDVDVIWGNKGNDDIFAQDCGKISGGREKDTIYTNNVNYIDGDSGRDSLKEYGSKLSAKNRDGVGHHNNRKQENFFSDMYKHL